jgi:acyl-coenzyme A thioesterase PaaI-like protein
MQHTDKVRHLIAENPFISFMEIEVSELGLGYAKFVPLFRKSLANSIGLLQGGGNRCHT